MDNIQLYYIDNEINKIDKMKLLFFSKRKNTSADKRHNRYA